MGLVGTSFEDLEIPEDYDIRQFEGMTLNFIVENNLAANILSHENEEFSRITGINIKIRPVDYDTLARKVNLDFIAQEGEYPLVYVDPYQTLNRFYTHLEILNPYMGNPSLPQISGYAVDFFEVQKEVCGQFLNNSNIYAIPFDSTTMILYYRKDIFEEYRDRFMEEMGYDWTPGTREFTWERYCEVSAWISQKVPDNQVVYGSGHMAQEHNSVFCDFSNILAAYGGDYFTGEHIQTVGQLTFHATRVMEEEFVQALEMYKKVVAASAPDSIRWNWTDSANAFLNGEIAMMPNWDENATHLENTAHSKVAGKIGYALLPYGDSRSGNIYGGSGIGINKYATEAEKQAAWLYIVWATSKEMQLRILQHPEGGSLPTRHSAYDALELQMDVDSRKGEERRDAYLKYVPVVVAAWEPENIYLRPKIANFYEVEQVLTEALHRMVAQDLDSRSVSASIYEALERIRGSGR
ncbi:extracellular solute-binding protein [Clostridiales bacterium F-3ap]|uniref:Extracellular solute-binding protein n=2 Tax=Anaerotalea alkaliphila TaxID=2662126 RepID=A0A7X5HTV1_9FIRM|nr:extracellular solute-binding protein [Anaerotalea alkaliphila]